MALDYGATGHFFVLGKELAITEAAARRPWRYSRLINSNWQAAGNHYFQSIANTMYANAAQPDDVAERASKRSLERLEAAHAAIHGDRVSDLEGFLLSYIAAAMELDDITVQEGAILYEYDGELLNSTGEVAILKEGGIFGALKRQMVADAKTIRVNNVTLGAITAGPGNKGQLTELTVGGGRSHALTGKLTLRCVGDQVGATELVVGNVLAEPLPDGTLVRPADLSLTVGTDFTDGPTGVSLQVRYVDLVKTGDGDDLITADPISWDKPNEEDGDKGKLYLRLTRVHATGPNPPVWLWEWFNNANREPEALVGSRTVDGVVGDIAVSIPGPNSNLSFTFDRTAAEAALPDVDDEDADIMLDQKVPRVGDTFTKTVVNDETGVISTKLAKTWPVSLNVATNPSQNIVDTHADSIPLNAG